MEGDPLIGEPPNHTDSSQENKSPQSWHNESNETVKEDIQIPDAEIERTQIVTMNVRSCFSGRKRTEVRDGIFTINPDVAILTETWLQEGNQESSLTYWAIIQS